jgi:hypothetical protein
MQKIDSRKIYLEHTINDSRHHFHISHAEDCFITRVIKAELNEEVQTSSKSISTFYFNISDIAQ